MNILFLDFDGVLNSKEHFLLRDHMPQGLLDASSNPELMQMRHDVSKNNMRCLRFVMDTLPDLKIVISSSWRNFYHVEQIKELFEAFKLDGERIIGITSQKMSSQRCHEIHWWLEDNHPVTKWLALDDHAIFNLEDMDKQNELLTDSWMGLTLPDAIKIIKHFKPDFKEPNINL